MSFQTQSYFNSISRQYSEVVVSRLNIEYKDLLGNLALLGRYDNSVLNNSTFDVKREIITKELTAISYIPICTQHVFLKKYTPSDKNDLFFWGDDDRDAYVAEIKRVLKDYLPTLEENVRSLFRNENSNIDREWNLLAKTAELHKKSITDILKRHAQENMFADDPLAYYETVEEKDSESEGFEVIINELKAITSKIENYE